jgi:hypothetical protein
MSYVSPDGTVVAIEGRRHTGFQVDYLSEDRMLINCGESYQVQLADNRFFGKHVRFGGRLAMGEDSWSPSGRRILERAFAHWRPSIDR